MHESRTSVHSWRTVFLVSLIHNTRLVEVIYLYFSKAFDTASNKILTGKLMKYRLGKWTMRWTEKHKVQLDANH